MLRRLRPPCLSDASCCHPRNGVYFRAGVQVSRKELVSSYPCFFRQLPGKYRRPACRSDRREDGGDLGQHLIALLIFSKVMSFGVSALNPEALLCLLGTPTVFDAVEIFRIQHILPQSIYADYHNTDRLDWRSFFHFIDFYPQSCCLSLRIKSLFC